MTAKTTIFYASFVLIGLLFSCGVEESGVYSVNVTYKKDCERKFRFSEQAGMLELSHVDCIFFDNGHTDKPTYAPIIRDKMYLIVSLEKNDLRPCQVTEVGEIVQATCEGISQPIALGYTTASENILINPNLSVDIFLKGADSVTYYDSSQYSKDSMSAHGIMAISARK